MLRKQRGFLDEFLLVTPEKREVDAISLWETKELAEIPKSPIVPMDREDRG